MPRFGACADGDVAFWELISSGRDCAETVKGAGCLSCSVGKAGTEKRLQLMQPACARFVRCLAVSALEDSSCGWRECDNGLPQAAAGHQHRDSLSTGSASVQWLDQLQTVRCIDNRGFSLIDMNMIPAFVLGLLSSSR